MVIWVVTSLPTSIILSWHFLHYSCQKTDQWIRRDFKSSLPRYCILLSRISHGPGQIQSPKDHRQGQRQRITWHWGTESACHDPVLRALFLQYRANFPMIPVIRSVSSKKTVLFLPRERNGLIHFPASNISELILPDRHNDIILQMYLKKR